MKPLRSGLAFVAIVTLGGCDIPTDPPMVEQRWIVPIDNTSISVEEFLPDGVGLLGDLFGVEVDPFTAEATLGELCASCVDGPGPAPAFQGTFSASRGFPADVSAAVLETGSVTVAVQNGFSFDPIEGGGSAVITLTDGPGGKVLGQTTISTGMAPGATVVRGIALAGGPVQPNLMAAIEVTSVGGQAAAINTGERITVTVEPSAISAGFVTVRVAGREVNIQDTDLDVADIDETISDHIQSGGIRLDVTNPFSVAVTLDLTIDYPGGTLSRTVEIEGTAVSSTFVSYSGDDFRLFLGKEGVTLRGVGSVAGDEAPIQIRTEERLEIAATLDLTLITG